MKTYLIAAALAGAAIATGSGVALAQNAAPNAAAPAKKQSVMTRAGAIAAADASFARKDANRDGRLTADERKRGSATGSRAEPITRMAYRERALARFDRADVNRDGRVEPAERQALKRGRGDDREPRHARRGDMGQGGTGKRGMGKSGMLKMADANRDGMITKIEMTNAAQMMFDRLDTNRDGRIDQAERGAMDKRGKSGRGAMARDNVG